MKGSRVTIILTAIVVLLSGCVETIYKIGKKANQIGKSEVIKTKALAGDAEAQYQLGKLYCCGESPDFDNVEALRWWCMSAKNGQRDAMLEVGRLYETSHEYKGSIIPRNNVMAYTYYVKAVENGNDDAVESLNRVENKLSKKEKEHSAYLLKQWPVIGCEITR